MMFRHYFVTIIVILVPSIRTQFTGCDFLQNVVPGQAYDIFSPGYDSYYMSGTNCRWNAVGPDNSKIILNCIDVVFVQIVETTVDEIKLKALRSLSSGFLTGKFRCQLTVQPQIPPLAQCDCGRRKSARIVGGTITGVNEFTMMAGLMERSIPLVFCGGTIISNNYVVTSAHCLINKQASTLSILVGDHDYDSQFETPYAASYPVSKITTHMYFDRVTNINDIGILTTSSSISYNVAVGPVCLPFPYKNILFADQTVEGVGWGTTSYGGEVSKSLKKASLNIISNAACSVYYPNIATSQMCVKTPYSDTCQRDSGGPIFGTIYGRVYLLGIISYGQGCATDYPSVNTRVTSYLDWIRENTYGAVYCQ